jgi:hypothetical protein
VQLPDFTQGLNRYSYALNNPLVYTDPTGDNPLAMLSWIAGAYLVGGYGTAIAKTGYWTPWGENKWSANNNEGWKAFHTGGAVAASITTTLIGLGGGFSHNISPWEATKGGLGRLPGLGFGSRGGQPGKLYWDGFNMQPFAHIGKGLNKITNLVLRKSYPRRLYVDKEGNMNTEEQIRKYMQWEREGRELAGGQEHALRRINIYMYPERMKSGFTMDESFDIYLGKDVIGVDLISEGWPAWDLSTTVQVGINQPQTYNIGNWGDHVPIEFYKGNINNVSFGTSGTFMGTGAPDIHFTQLFFNLIVTKKP